MPLSIAADTATTDTATTDTATTGGDYKFEIIVKSYQSSYWQAAVTGVNQKAEELGVTVNCTGPNAESDIADQFILFLFLLFFLFHDINQNRSNQHKAGDYLLPAS